MTRPLRMVLLSALLAVATLAAYAPTFSAGFVDVDDPDSVSYTHLTLPTILLV